MAGKPSAKKLVESQHTNKRLKAGRSGSLKGGDAKSPPSGLKTATPLKFRKKEAPSHKTVQPNKSKPHKETKQLTEFGKRVEANRKKGIITEEMYYNERNKRRYNMPRSL